MKKNSAIISEGLDVMAEMLAPYAAQQLQGYYKKDWWREGVLNKINDTNGLPTDGDFPKLVNAMDALLSLKLINLNWQDVFAAKLSREHRNWANELITTRNKMAHMSPMSDFIDDDAWRALDTMARLME